MRSGRPRRTGRCWAALWPSGGGLRWERRPLASCGRRVSLILTSLQSILRRYRLSPLGCHEEFWSSDRLCLNRLKWASYSVGPRHFEVRIIISPGSILCGVSSRSHSVTRHRAVNKNYTAISWLPPLAPELYRLGTFIRYYINPFDRPVISYHAENIPLSSVMTPPLSSLADPAR